jgi:hypothetical protein
MENKKTTEIKNPDIQDNQRYWDNLADKINKTYQDVNATTTVKGVYIRFYEDWYNTETLRRGYDCYIKDDIELIALMNKMVRVPNYKLEKQKITTDELPKRIKDSYSEPTKKLIALGYKKLCIIFGLDLEDDVLFPLIRDELVDGDDYEIVESKRTSTFQHDNFDEETYSLTFEYSYGVDDVSETEEGISFKFGATIDYDWERDSGSIDFDNYTAEIPSAMKCGKFEDRITIEEYILYTIGLIKKGLKKDEIGGREDDLLDKFHELEKECMTWADDKAYEYDGQENCDCWVSSVSHK